MTRRLKLARDASGLDVWFSVRLPEMSTPDVELPQGVVREKATRRRPDDGSLSRRPNGDGSAITLVYLRGVQPESEAVKRKNLNNQPDQVHVAHDTRHLPALVIQALDEVFDAVPVGDCITAEMVRERISYDMRCLLALPIYRAGLGGYFQRKAKAKRIQAEGFTTAQRDDARGRPIKVWRRVA